MICIVCRKELRLEDDKFMLALDRPYLNLWVHKSCWNQIKDNLKDFFTQEVIEFMYNNIVNGDKNERKSRKIRRNS